MHATFRSAAQFESTKLLGLELVKTETNTDNAEWV